MYVSVCLMLKIIPRGLTADEELVVRQAFAGLCWSKQFYYFDSSSQCANGTFQLQLYISSYCWLHFIVMQSVVISAEIILVLLVIFFY